MLFNRYRFTVSSSPLVGLVFVLCASVGCVTPSDKQRRRGSAGTGPSSVKTQPIDRSKSFEKAGRNTPDSAQEELAPLTTEEQLVFIKKQIDATRNFDQVDRGFLARLPKDPAAGSISEAAVAVGVIRLSLEQAPSFQEDDLTGVHSESGARGDFTDEAHEFGQPSETGQGWGSDAPNSADDQGESIYSLEHLSSEFGVNLADAFADNVLLTNPAIMQLAYQAIQLPGNSERFQEELHSTLARLATQWNASLAAIQPATNSVAPVPSEEDSAQAPVQISALRSDDALMAEAQLLADQGQYQEAITRVLSVPEESALKTQADEKLKDFSNMAVQDLRRKAAQAFQSAIPIQDIELRKQYLQQAKAYLEEAIKVYPHATYLPTVRDNLREISRDLERLNHNRG